jgi:hypothetical protein
MMNIIQVLLMFSAPRTALHLAARVLRSASES